MAVSVSPSYFSILLLVACLLCSVTAIPRFNQVNGYQLNGERCPLQTYHAYPCPRLCVRDIALCPPSIRPTCDEGRIYCVDGTCRDRCPTDLISLCSCPGAPALQGAAVYPCRSGNTVDIPNYNSTLQSYSACASGLDISPVSNWVPNPAERMWGQCPAPDYGVLTFVEPIFISLYIFYGSCLATLGGWYLYKHKKEKVSERIGCAAREKRRVHLDDHKNEKKPSLDDASSLPETPCLRNGNDDMLVRAYRCDFLGTSCFVLYGVQTLGMVVYMILMTYDYYNGYLFFKGNQLIQTSTYIGMWYIFTGWFIALVLFRDRLPNFFRIQCDDTEGEYVQVEKDEPAIIFIEEGNSIINFVRYLERVLKSRLGQDVVVTTVPLSRTRLGERYFVYQCTRYVFHQEQQQFIPHAFHLGDTCSDLASQTSGLTNAQAQTRLEMIGANFIEVYVPNFPMALLREFASFFYVYQFTILWLFYYYDYWQVGIADTAVILLSAFVKVIVRLKAERRIQKMAEFTDQIPILRDGTWQSLSTADLVPGDVIQIEAGKVAPCDAVVLSGQIVADESSLTGEPLPIRKLPLRPDDSTCYDRMGQGKMSTLFAGTIISQAQPSTPDTLVTALVTHTGTATDKGQLVKKILFPTRVSFIFDEQIKLVILILLCCGMVILALAVWLYAAGTPAWFYATFAIAQLVSPLLPAALVVGQSVAASRLKKKQIYCVDLPRILMAGKVQLFCFDKTGTLTREGLEFYGAQPIDQASSNYQGDTLPCFDEHRLAVGDLPRLMQISIATCHSVTLLNDQFIGNPVDIEMFRASKWTLQESGRYLSTMVPPATVPGQHADPVHIIKRFEFVHARMSMSVAVLDTQTDRVHIFVKGAYEKIKDLCRSESLPANYDRVTADLARQGCYVLSVAHRQLDLQAVGGMDGFREWTRDQMEEHIDFMGLLVFKNQLKPDTAENIAKLKSGGTRTIMITGDTALTGTYIARQCGMVPAGTNVLLGDYDIHQDTVVWTDVDQPDALPIDTEKALMRLGESPTELAVTGKAFQWLIEHDMIRQYLLDIRVFARMTPNEKVQCVQLHMERGITAMTGDGGNDCGALRAAHVGIAMSDAEASIVSPFSTSRRSVASCVELIRQGRGALATSLTGYKYLILYGQVMMALKIFSFYFSMSMPQNVWIAVDLFITVLLTWAVSQSKPAKTLEDQRPTARLLGPQTLASCIGLVAINWIFMIGAFAMLFQQSWFRCNEFDSTTVDVSKWTLLSKYYEPEVASIVCLTQFVNNAAVFNFGYKFRQSWWRNVPLVLLWAGYLTIISYWTLADPNPFGCLFQINCGTRSVLAQLGYNLPSHSRLVPYDTPLGHNVMPVDFRWKLWSLCVGNVLAALVYEKFIVLGPVHAYLARRFPVNRSGKKCGGGMGGWAFLREIRTQLAITLRVEGYTLNFLRRLCNKGAHPSNTDTISIR
ncbi:hypothetical protein BX666DRAFT_2147537 [Dichotomocladium elegans]|nr:hypothetical protein BX666DRAFT_2147537 [Dichotomocladium elegans]